MIFILVNRRSDNYTSIAELDDTVHFVFDAVNSIPTQEDFDTTMKILAVLDKADPETDTLILNGPSWLQALAGFVWFTDERRRNANLVMWHGIDAKYKHVHLNLKALGS